MGLRRAAARDGNEDDLLKEPRAHGWTVLLQSEAGRPDWLCMKRGRVVFIEVKEADGTLTAAQQREFPRFAAAGVPIHVCRTREDVRRALGLPGSTVAIVATAPPGPHRKPGRSRPKKQAGLRLSPAYRPPKP